MAGLPALDEAKLWTNFPFAQGVGPAGDAADPYREPPLVVASAVNALRFLDAAQPLRRRAHLAAWRDVKESCERLLLFTASCGSAIVAALERRAPAGAAVELCSFGPVEPRAHGLPQRRIVGSRDWMSRRGDVVVPDVGHMGYLGDASAVTAAHAWLRERLGTEVLG